MATRPTPKKRGATTSRRRSSSRSRPTFPGWLWALAGLVAGFLLSQHQHGSAPWQDEQDSPMATVMPRFSADDPTATPDTTTDSASEESPMPTFEFYTLLPESEVIAPRSELPDTAARAPAPPAEPTTETVDDPIAQVIAANARPEDETAADDTSTDSQTIGAGDRYMLQAASFRESGDAEQLRSRLSDFGLLARVSEVQAGGNETWHRVQVGPYDDTRELNRAQDLMTTQGIEPLVIRLQN
ncbi:SPOR domain-containing protein [Halomonas sp. TRM85114]|uniref:SPOR domain-containing protein n=1 Tax=Halomonas jincaotanensis TaxID=2810616 RepID=UPI001BD3AAEA|nr:SPOR domain-containing protein [Halomonas jincaotanensis]MBS9403150.1 SPOR domain-containing protein [Halomonas jincaotanensis]